MGATLDALRSLQEIEHQIRDIKRQLIQSGKLPGFDYERP